MFHNFKSTIVFESFTMWTLEEILLDSMKFFLMTNQVQIRIKCSFAIFTIKALYFQNSSGHHKRLLMKKYKLNKISKISSFFVLFSVTRCFQRVRKSANWFGILPNFFAQPCLEICSFSYLQITPTFFCHNFINCPVSIFFHQKIKKIWSHRLRCEVAWEQK